MTYNHCEIEPKRSMNLESEYAFPIRISQLKSGITWQQLVTT